MKQIQQKQEIHYCFDAQHSNSQILMICLNESCKNCKLLCHKCLQQDLHFGHNQDLIKNSELSDFFEQQKKELICYIQQQIDNISDQLNKLKSGISQKYNWKLELMNVQQIAQAIEDMIKFKYFKNQISQEISGVIQNIILMFENLYQSLQLDNTQQCTNKTDKDKAKEFYNQGFQLWKDDKYQEAIKILDKSLSLDPRDHITLWCKGSCLRMLVKYNDAIHWLDKALDIDPKHVDSLFSKGECLRMIEKYNDALNLVDQALSIDPNHENSIATKAFSLKGLGKYKEALVWFNKALAIDPDWSAYKNGRKFCLDKLEISK